MHRTFAAQPELFTAYYLPMSEQFELTLVTSFIARMRRLVSRSR